MSFRLVDPKPPQSTYPVLELGFCQTNTGEDFCSFKRSLFYFFKVWNHYEIPTLCYFSPLHIGICYFNWLCVYVYTHKSVVKFILKIGNSQVSNLAFPSSLVFITLRRNLSLGFINLWLLMLGKKTSCGFSPLDSVMPLPTVRFQTPLRISLLCPTSLTMTLSWFCRVWGVP